MNIVPLTNYKWSCVASLFQKGMRIYTSRGHLPLQHLLRGFQVFEVWIVAMKRWVNAFPQNVVTLAFPTQCPPCYGCMPHLARRGRSFVVKCRTRPTIHIYIRPAKIAYKITKRIVKQAIRYQKITKHGFFLLFLTLNREKNEQNGVCFT